MIAITIREYEGCGLFDAYLGAERLCRSRTPLLTSARVLLQRGIDPATRLEVRREGRSQIDMAATVRGAAALTVRDSKQGKPRFSKIYGSIPSHSHDEATEQEAVPA